MLEITAVRTRVYVYKGNNTGPLRGFGEVDFGPVTLLNFRILEGRDGLWVSAPQNKGKAADAGYFPSAHKVQDQELRRTINDKLIQAFNNAASAVNSGQQTEAPNNEKSDDSIKSELTK